MIERGDEPPPDHGGGAPGRLCAIVQEFVDGGEDGDARIFLLEGRILERDGKQAAFRRVPTGGDPRANISAGGRSVPLEIGEVELGIIDAMSDKPWPTASSSSAST